MNEHVNRLIVRRGDIRTGARYGRLRVLGTPFWLQFESRWREASVVCECSCGGVCVVPCSNLSGGETKSCGCIRARVGSRL